MRRFNTILATSAAAGLLIGCGAGPGTGPSEPTMPEGTLLLYDPRGFVHTADAGTGASREVSRFGEPILYVGADLSPLADKVIGGSSGVGQPDRGIREVSLGTGAVTTISVYDRVIYANAISPDAKALAFAGVGAWPQYPTRHALVTLDIATRTTRLHYVAPESAPEQALADLRWLPDGSGLVAHLYDGGTVNLAWVVHFDLVSAVITPITEPETTLEMIRTLDLSPDGQTIAFNTVTGELRFITLSGSPAPGFPTDLRGVLPAFSPDGKLLAWSRYRDDTTQLDGVWYYRFSDGKTWRALPADSPLTWVLDWE